MADVMSLTGPEGPAYLMLTHVDDVSDHNQWAERFPSLKRIFHSGDLGRQNWRNDESLEEVEVLLQPGKEGDQLTAYTLDGTMLDDNWRDDLESGALESDVIVLHTPGHSAGSISLYYTGGPGVLFTGDTYAYSTRKGGSMTGFPLYVKESLRTQADTISKLCELDWCVIAPGHGHSRDYRQEAIATRKEEMKLAIEDLKQSPWWEKRRPGFG